jgi:hypothetical protein
MGLMAIGHENVNWIEFSPDMLQWQADVKTAMDFLIP